jgi:hypothetical protein
MNEGRREVCLAIDEAEWLAGGKLWASSIAQMSDETREGLLALLKPAYSFNSPGEEIPLYGSNGEVAGKRSLTFGCSSSINGPTARVSGMPSARNKP